MAITRTYASDIFDVLIPSADIEKVEAQLREALTIKGNINWKWDTKRKWTHLNFSHDSLWEDIECAFAAIHHIYEAV